MVHALIFGPTGAVGSAAAAEAHSKGATLTLAMREPTKTLRTNIAHLNLPRLQADLSDLASVTRAAEESKADAAFVYVMLQQDTHEYFNALKAGGVKHVVLLSSITVYAYPDVKAALNGNFIAKRHAEAEIALQASGLSFTIARPGSFASKFLQAADEIKKRTVSVHRKAGFTEDWIAPEDVGAVCGASLFANKSEIIPILGPQLTTPREAWKVVSDELGLGLEIEEVSTAEWRKVRSTALPPFLVDALVDIVEHYPPNDPASARYQEGSAMVQQRCGRAAIKLRPWIRAHRDELLAAASSS